MYILIGSDSFLWCTRPQPSSRLCTENRKSTNGRENTQILTWKPKMWEKPRQPTSCRNTLWGRYRKLKKHRGNDLTLLPSPHGGYNEATTSVSLSLSLSLCTRAIQLLTKNATTTKMFALSHIYTYMTFGLFIHMAPRGSREHIPSNRSDGSTSDPRSSGSP